MSRKAQRVSRDSRERREFTLVELIIAVMLVGILIAMVVPVLIR